MQTRKYRKSTITDVAAKAGVSVSTVSAYVRGRSTVCSPETAVRITNAIAELHYSPGPAARGSRDRSTNTIGSTLRDPASYETLADIMFHFRLRIGVQRAMYERGLALLTYPWDLFNPIDYGAIIDGRVDGVLFAAQFADTRPEKIARAGLPIVVFECYLSIPEGCGAAFASESDVVSLAIEHLWSLGHRRIAHVSGRIATKPSYISPYDRPHEFAIGRYQHFIELMTERSAYDPRLMVHADGGWRISDDQANTIVAAWKEMPDRPSAVFCANDRLAYGIVNAARAQGLRVPEDLSVVGVDNEPRSQAEGLTTVDIPLEAVGRAGAAALLDLMDGKPALECRPMIAVNDLVVRGTTAAVRETSI